MGCAASIYKVRGNKKPMNIPLVTIFTPSLRIPISSSFNKPLKGLVPNDLIDRLTYSRNQVTLLANQTGVPELLRALEGYLSLLVGLTDQELGFRELVEFKWRTLDDGGQEICVADSWFELLSVVHMMAILTLIQANSKLIPDQTDSSETVESTDKIRCAVDLLVKAAGYLQFCLREILVKIPQDIKAMVQRLQGMEQRQQQMMSFLAKVVNSPGFLAQFVQQQNESTRLITEGNKKRRYKEDGVISNSNEHSSDGRTVRYQPAMNDAAQAMLKQLMKLDNSSSRLNTFTSGVTLQEVAPPASGQSYLPAVTGVLSAPLEANSEVIAPTVTDIVDCQDSLDVSEL